MYYVFIDTGIEWQATYNHIKYLEEKYQISIQTIKGMPIPIAVKQFGVPIISKEISSKISQLQKHQIPLDKYALFDEHYYKSAILLCFNIC